MTALLAALLLVLASPISTSDDPPEKESVLTEHVTVTAARLPVETEPLDRVPAHVTVIDREAIERSGSRTLQELLATEAGVVLYDQVGNGLERTLDFRGFSEGTGTKVFLDGAPLNDSRNNGLSLHLIPMEVLERVEIVRGSATALAGGGAQAGVVHLRTRRGAEFGGSLGFTGGSDSSNGFSGEIGDSAGRLDYFLSATRESTDGFRLNGGGDLRRLAATLGLSAGAGRRLELAVVDTLSKLGNPGALTTEEFEDDPSSSPYNSLDFTNDRFTQAALNFRQAPGGDYSLAANLFVREREVEGLATGRAGHLFGGAYLESDSSALGSTVQFTHGRVFERSEHDLTIGLDLLDGETLSTAYRTPLDDLARVDPDALFSSNRADRRTVAIYALESWRPAPGWNLVLGARWDRDGIDYDESHPDTGNDDSVTWSELSLRAGASWSPSGRLDMYLSYGEAFLPPTVEQLFSYPGFGSTTDLLPEDSRSYEYGIRYRRSEALNLDAALFLTDTVDEIVFTFTDPDHPFGINANVGETRRSGIEASLRGRIAGRLRYYLNATLMNAELRKGDNRGRDVPLVPGERFAAGFDLELQAGLDLRAELLYTGEQVLDGDEANALPPLDSYTVLNARASWALPRFEQLRLLLEITNLLDREYAVRGIYAYDFITEQSDDFYTPAPGRRFRAGVRWAF